MQLRLSNGSSSPFHSSNPQHPRKHKQQAIFTYNNHNHPLKNVYYDTNPYLLQTSPSEPHFKNLPATSRNSSRSHEYSDVNSQRSGKVVRANGLRLVQKPSLNKVQEQSPVNGIRINEQSRRMMQRQFELQSENKALRGQNQYLKQRVRILEDSRNFEKKALEQKIDYLQKVTQSLQKKMQLAQQQWKQQVQKLKNQSPVIYDQ